MIKLYCRYIDDTLLLVIPADILYMQNVFNRFDKNLCFIVDCFENEIPHFLGIKVCF